jgi:hypothetical protein
MNIWDEVKSLKIGTAIPKVEEGKSAKLIEFTKSNGDESFKYSIGENGNGKCVLKSEIEESFTILQTSGKFTREWHKEHFPQLESGRPCNFTTIGGIFELLGYAKYASRSEYDKTDKDN